MGKAVGLAARVAASAAVALALPGVASAQHGAPAGRAAAMSSTTFAGYEYANYVAIPESVSATMVVPSLKCKSGDEQAVYAEVAVEGETSAAGLVIGCNGKQPYYWPSVTVDSAVKNYPTHKAHPGDKINLSVDQSFSTTTVSVIDKTHSFNVNKSGAGGGTGVDLRVGEDAWDDPTELGVPNFGTLKFSNAMLNGSPFGSFGSASSLEQIDRYSSTSPAAKLEIATGAFASNNQDFKSVFKHS